MKQTTIIGNAGKWLLLWAAVFSCSQGMAQQAPTLAELAERAIAKSYDLANAELAIDAERETRQSIREVYLPHVEANGKYAYLNSDLKVDIPTATLPLLDLPIFEGSTSFPTHGNLWTADLTASAVLFSGTKAPKMGKALDYKIKAEEHLLDKQRQELIDKVSTAYDQLALLKQVNRVLGESRKRLAIEKETAEKAFGYGLITSYELQKVDVAQATLAAKQQEYEGKHDLLLKQLHQLTDVPVDQLEAIDSELLPYSIGNAASGIENRPEIAALDAAIEANSYKIAAEKTHWIPKVQAVARVGYYGLSDAALKTPYHLPVSGQPLRFELNQLQAFPTFTVGIGMKWDIFDGNIGKREVNKARIALKQAENNRAQADELLRLNLDKAQSEYLLANKQLNAAEVRQTTAQKAVQLAHKEYQVGLIKVSERIGAENDYQQAALDYVQSVFDQRRAAFQLLLATGDLTIDQLK